MQKYPIVSLPDDEPYRWWKLFPDTIVIHYGEALDTFLLLGDERALLIDTAYGRGDFPNIVEELREGRELLVVNTHGHYDHTGGNPFFPRIYMHENAKAYCRKAFGPTDPEWFANMPHPDYECIAVDDGYIFDLGNRQVEVLYTPAHCDSSLMFIDHKRRLLFSGDEFDAGQANLPAEDKVEPFLRNMRRLLERSDEFDWIMPNHNGCPICKDYLQDFATAAEHVVKGRPDLVSREGLPDYKLGFGPVITRVQVGQSCINYPPAQISDSRPPCSDGN